LTDGTVLGCSAIAAMDAAAELRIGNILQQDLLAIYTGELMRQLRAQFLRPGVLNRNCAACDDYLNCEMYRTQEGRIRAALNRKRSQGQVVNRTDRARSPFSGG
jgi:hypothetical protein